MQARVRVEARTCKHIREVLGDAYENARAEAATCSGVNEGGDAKANVKIADKKGKGKAIVEDKKPNVRASRSASKAVGPSKTVLPEDVKSEEDEEGAGTADNGVDVDMLTFDGVKPNRTLADGESVEVNSHTRYAMKSLPAV